jgi:D-amino peptidase
MKVFISIDMEGVACVTNWDHVKPVGVDYEIARKWMTAEANAAIDGALEMGATEVVVADAHYKMCNILPSELHKDALLVRGSPRTLTMMEGLNETFDAVFLVGYHSMAGTDRGILAHTYVSKLVHAVRLNGITVGELGINAAIAGHFGVPVAMVCGDDTLDEEVGKLLPLTERVITKWAISPYSALNLTPMASQFHIRESAKRALGRLDEIKPFVLENPIRFEVDFMYALNAYVAADIPGTECFGGRTLVYTGEDIIEIIRIWRLILNASLGEVFV